LEFTFLQTSPILESKNFQQYESVFLQLADEHRTISAFELQELLEACLPNGMKYIGNDFNINSAWWNPFLSG